MLAPSRHHRILELLEEHDAVSLAILRDELPVTGMTLWRDLAALENQGKLRRVHGGAVRPGRTAEPAFRQKVRRSLEEKRRIAARAAEEFVAKGDVVVLEGGTTVAEMLPRLTAPRITVLTNSVPILARAHASFRHLALHGSGGVISGVSGNMVGDAALDFFARMKAGTFFLSGTALDLESGRLTDPNPIEIAVKRAMAAAATRVVLLLDATKLGRMSVEEVLPLREIDAIVTDRRVTAAQRRRLSGLFPRVIVA